MENLLEIIRTGLVLVHLIGFALLFGGWAAQALAGRRKMTTVFRSGLGVMIGSGLILAIPFPAGIELDYVKLAIKLAIALSIGAMFGLCITRERAGQTAPIAFWLIGGLALLNAGIALFWH